MHAFIIRPFGVKQDIDFEAVERDLIGPALTRLNITGRTTADIVRAGSIRADMFQLLLTADLVIADMSIHNANVFYELGVRHALRDRQTFLIRASVDEVPFDLKTDRYLAYDPANPAASLDGLVAGLAATLREQVVDSPVYGLVPGLKPPDPTAFVVVPRDFREEVEIAQAAGAGGDLRFLAAELEGLRWKREGRRIIGQAQFDAKDLEYAAETWESIREELPDDVQANLRLGTIYQKRTDLVRSDQALHRVVAIQTLPSEDIAEARALLGSNEKTRWLSDWDQTAATDDAGGRQVAALQSPHLRGALTEYAAGFAADPRHYYSGLNALALAVVLTELAAKRPTVWNGRFADEDDARSELKGLTRLRSQLAGAVEFSLGAAKQRLTRLGRSDPWLDVSVADLAFLMTRPNVQQLYRDVLGRLGQFAASSVRRQFDTFSRLGILPGSVEAAAPLFPAGAEPSGAPVQSRILLFTGHRIDAADRPVPRFPAAQEETARAAIESAVREAAGATPSGVHAIAGGASGGDLLFLEVCEALGIPRHLFLIIPREDYVRESVGPAGANWVRRFNHQFETAATRIYQRSPVLPGWLQDKPSYNVWERSNNWMLHNALFSGGRNTTLIALWDGKGGDGPGGTQHMVDVATGRGAQIVVLDTQQIFGQRTAPASRS